MTILAITVLTAVCISFLCSLLESSLLSLRPADVAELRHRSPEIGAMWEKLRQNIEQPIAAVLILNTIANTFGASIAGAQFARVAHDMGFSTSREWVAQAGFSLFFAFLIIQWGEILPKTLGVRYRMFVAGHVGPGLRASVGMLRPVMWLTRTLNRPFERHPDGEGFGTVEEIQSLVRYASFARLIDRRQERIMTKTVQLDETSIERIMAPRTAVAALEVDQSVADLLALVHKKGYSRIPIYRHQLDDIVGVVLAKDILKALHEGKLTSDQMTTRKVGEFMIEPVFMPETSSIADMLAHALEKNAHMVIALDEHGGFAGLVTFEDAIGELFGEIAEEHDRAERLPIERTGRNRWVATGRCPIDKVSREVGVDLSSPDHDYTTLSGLLMMRSGNVPKAGDVVRAGGLTFEVIEATPTMPKRIEITKRV